MSLFCWKIILMLIFHLLFVIGLWLYFLCRTFNFRERNWERHQPLLIIIKMYSVKIQIDKFSDIYSLELYMVRTFVYRIMYCLDRRVWEDGIYGMWIFKSNLVDFNDSFSIMAICNCMFLLCLSSMSVIFMEAC